MTSTITFATQTQATLFSNELVGQFSDGMWENASPSDHWRFWGNLEVKVGPEVGVVTATPWECKKTGYNFKALAAIVGDRMITMARMATVTTDEQALRASEYMPATFEEWAKQKSENKFKYEFVAKYMVTVTEEIAKAFYASTYGEDQLFSDLKAIKKIMKSAKK